MNDFIEKPPFINEKLAIFIIGFLSGILVCYTWSNARAGNDTNTGATISTIKEQQHGVNNEIHGATERIENASQTAERVTYTINGVQKRINTSERIVIENADRISRIEEIVRDCRSIAEENRAILNNVGKAN